MKEKLHIAFHCPECYEITNKNIQGQFSSTYICENVYCRKVIAFKDVLFVVRFYEKLQSPPLSIDGAELACPSCNDSSIDTPEKIDNITQCLKCGKKSQLLDFIHLMTSLFVILKEYSSFGNIIL